MYTNKDIGITCDNIVKQFNSLIKSQREILKRIKNLNELKNSISSLESIVAKQDTEIIKLKLKQGK